jgi:hypothetical protein
MRRIIDFLLREQVPSACSLAEIASLCTGSARARSCEMKSEHENASGNNSRKAMMGRPPEIGLTGF